MDSPSSPENPRSQCWHAFHELRGGVREKMLLGGDPAETDFLLPYFCRHIGMLATDASGLSVLVDHDPRQWELVEEDLQLTQALFVEEIAACRAQIDYALEHGIPADDLVTILRQAFLGLSG